MIVNFSKGRALVMKRILKCLLQTSTSTLIIYAVIFKTAVLNCLRQHSLHLIFKWKISHSYKFLTIDGNWLWNSIRKRWNQYWFITVKIYFTECPNKLRKCNKLVILKQGKCRKKRKTTWYEIVLVQSITYLYI